MGSIIKKSHNNGLTDLFGGLFQNMGVATVVTGGFMSLIGISIWNRSKNNANQDSSNYAYTKDLSLSIQPKFYHNNNESYQGLSIMYQYWNEKREIEWIKRDREKFDK